MTRRERRVAPPAADGTWSRGDGYQRRAFGALGMGGFPDFADPGDCISPFMIEDGFLFLKLPYRSRTILHEVLPRSRRQAERGWVVAEFSRAREIIARDVPLLPRWPGRRYVAARGDIRGVRWTLDATCNFRLRELEKGADR